MKRKFFCLTVIFIMALTLIACTDKSDIPEDSTLLLEPMDKGDNTEAADLLLESIDKFEASGSYSYISETMTQNSDFSSESLSETSVISSPYVMLTSSTSSMGEGNKMQMQTYYRENSDGSLDIFTRSKMNEESKFGEWNQNHTSPEDAELLLPAIKNNMKGNLELLRANKKLFKNTGNEKIDDKNTIVLKGAITPDSAAQIYIDFFRDYYRKAGIVIDKDITAEEAKKEVKTSESPDLQVGILALVNSSNNIPVTIWVDAETHIPVKSVIDKSEALEKSIDTFKLIALDPLVTITIPEGVN